METDHEDHHHHDAEDGVAQDGDAEEEEEPNAVQKQLTDPDHDPDAAETSASGSPSAGVAVADILNTDEIFRRVAATADDEFERSMRTVFFSGLSAGLSLGVTFLARAALGSETGSGPGLPGDLLYPLGFVLVVMGRYQLFTENTLTPVTLVMARLASIPALLRLWGVVFAANIVGAVVAALLLDAPHALTAESTRVADEIARTALSEPLATLFIRGLIAGGLVASMVWLVHAVRDGVSRLLIIYGIMLLIPVAGLYHCITGFVEVFYGFRQGDGTLLDAVGFLAAVSVGNIVGGIALVAAINYGQTADSRLGGDDRNLRLSWGDWLFRIRTGSSVAEPEIPPSAGN